MPRYAKPQNLCEENDVVLGPGGRGGGWGRWGEALEWIPASFLNSYYCPYFHHHEIKRKFKEQTSDVESFSMNIKTHIKYFKTLVLTHNSGCCMILLFQVSEFQLLDILIDQKKSLLNFTNLC